jgi:transcriptional regulator with XRE-family HTH domain
MIIGERLRELREAKKLSQGDIEKRTGLLRCYISRVENGHTVPAIETLEKMARALELPLYKLFYEGNVPAELANLPRGANKSERAWGGSGADVHLLARFRRHLSRMGESRRRLLLSLALKMTARVQHRRRAKT